MNPVRTALIIPRDYPCYDGRAFDAGYWSQASAIVQEALRQNKAWVERETGHTYTYTYELHFSNLDIKQIMTADPAVGFVAPIPWWDGQNPNEAAPPPLLRASGNQRAPTPEGQGLDENRIWHDICQGEMGWPVDDTGLGGRRYRRFVVVVGGGGYAGGRSGLTATEDYGEAIWGDWFLRLLVTGTADPACMAEYHNPLRNADGSIVLDSAGHWVYEDYGFCRPGQGNVFGSLGHEVLHGFNVDSHYPKYLILGDAWTDEQRASFVTLNGAFIEPVPEPEPEPEPAPVTLVGLHAPSSLTVKTNRAESFVVTAVYSDGTTEMVVPLLSEASQKFSAKNTVAGVTVTAGNRPGDGILTISYGGIDKPVAVNVKKR